MRDYEFYYTLDGSIGLFSHNDNDVYHSKFGAVSEAWEKFILPSNISKLINKKEEIKVLDLCYGIGYNTKTLMSCAINQNKKFLKKEKFINKFIKKIKKILKNNDDKKKCIESIDTNKIKLKNEILSESIDSIQNDIVSKFYIDCLDINEELLKISPLLKTVITPQEIFYRTVPEIFSCFKLYWRIKNIFNKFLLKFSPKNKKEIEDLLNIKFGNNYNELTKEYRIHDFVNYIIIDNLIEKYNRDYFDINIRKILKEKKFRPFFAKTLLRYAEFKQDFRYKIIRRLNLSTNLHNIYYDHLSNRYKKAKFNLAKGLFKLNFYVDDARKSILLLNNKYDLIFLDAFTYSKAPELWTVEFIAELYKRLAATGIIMTYSNSALVRNTFLENKFYVGKIFNEKTGKFIGTIATKDKSLIEYPLTNYEIGLCNTKAGIPYHDPNLSLPKEIILKNREAEFKSSKLMTSSQYARLRSYKKGEYYE